MLPVRHLILTACLLAPVALSAETWTLDRAVATALERSPDARIARARKRLNPGPVSIDAMLRFPGVEKTPTEQWMASAPAATRRGARRCRNARS